MVLNTEPLWACPRCHTKLPPSEIGSGDHTLPFKSATRVVHTSASLEHYDGSCPGCELPYTTKDGTRFEYPYRQMLAALDHRRFLRWSAAQNNGYVSYMFMRGSSCSIDGRTDATQFAEFIRTHAGSDPSVVVDLGRGPLSRPSYLPPLGDATLIGVDPFNSEWSGRFIQGVGEFLPLQDASVDLVIAATALDHALDVTQVLRELARVTRRGGSLMIWDHTFRKRAQQVTGILLGLLGRAPLRQNLTQFFSGVIPERVRVYDNGIVLWTPKGYSDPFHEPQSRRVSWRRKLRRVVEGAGFVQVAEDPTMGFSHFVKT